MTYVAASKDLRRGAGRIGRVISSSVTSVAENAFRPCSAKNAHFGNNEVLDHSATLGRRVTKLQRKRFGLVLLVSKEMW